MIPYRFFVPAMLLTAWSTVAATAEDAGPSSKPNIVFVLSAAHAAHAVSAYGNRINRTPNIDRLSREGVQTWKCTFSRCCCPR